MQDTIFALATPAGQSAIAVFRISGLQASALGARLSGYQLSHREAKPALIKDEAGLVLDDVVLLFFKGPQSATGEDTIEIHCHGSLSVTSAISAYLSRQPSVRPAQPGEFTKRAFDNGKMDLTEIEGLADLIESQTESQRRQALGQLKGHLRLEAEKWRGEIIHLAARLESLIDFSDEDLPESVADELTTVRQRLITSLSAVLNDSGRGELIRNGLEVVLVGPVNAGKSTALNALAGRPAAIVTDEAGTTRDIVEVRLDIDGIAVILKDTAGIRDKAGQVEAIGIARARQAANEADLVILLADGAQENWHEEADAIAAEITSPMIKFVNKQDMMATTAISAEGYQAISLHHDEGVALLEEQLAHHCADLNHSGAQVFITRDRHRLAIQTAKDSLLASQDYNFDTSPEIVAEDMRLAAHALSQMLGHIDVEDILSDIFSSFCIGK